MARVRRIARRPSAAREPEASNHIRCRLDFSSACRSLGEARQHIAIAGHEIERVETIVAETIVAGTTWRP